MSSNRSYTRIMGALLNRPLFAHPRTAVTVYNALSDRFGTAVVPAPSDDAEMLDSRWQPGARRERLAVKASRFEGERVQNASGGFPRVEPFLRTKDGVGIITIDGELVNRGAWIGDDGSGAVSYEGLKFQLKRAAQDNATKAVILDINSPGGEATGADEVAAIVRAVREVKPVYAVANGMAASAGYAIASGATRIFNAPMGMVGSIGCVMLHMDMSGKLEKEGMKPTMIFAGKHKVDGNFAGPLPDEVKAELQNEVDLYYSLFLDTVAAGRGRRLSAKAARETEARTFLGQQAVDTGVADAIGTFDDVLAETTSKVRRQASKPSQTRNKSMANLGIDDSQNDEAHAAAIASAEARGRAAGVEEGKKVGATEAYARVTAILANEAIAGREVHAVSLAVSAPEMSVDAITAFCSKIPAAAPAPAPAPVSAVQPLAQRVAATGVDQVLAGQAGTPHGQVPVEGDPDAGWGAALAPVKNERMKQNSRA